MSLFRDIEKRIDAQLKKLFTSESAAAQGKELIEIQRLILDEVEDHAQMLPRARRRFPYNDLIVRIAAPEPDRRSAIEVVFIEGNALQAEIANHLRSEQIEVPPDLQVHVEPIEDPPAEIASKSFHIIYNSRETAKPQAKSKQPVRLTVLHGAPNNPHTRSTNRVSISAASPKYSMNDAARSAATT